MAESGEPCAEKPEEGSVHRGIEINLKHIKVSKFVESESLEFEN